MVDVVDDDDDDDDDEEKKLNQKVSLQRVMTNLDFGFFAFIFCLHSACWKSLVPREGRKKLWNK